MQVNVIKASQRKKQGDSIMSDEQFAESFIHAGKWSILCSTLLLLGGVLLATGYNPPPSDPVQREGVKTLWQAPVPSSPGTFFTLPAAVDTNSVVPRNHPTPPGSLLTVTGSIRAPLQRQSPPCIYKLLWNSGS
jgi:hypothetical protein